MPEDKVDAVNKLRKTTEVVMVGNSVNVNKPPERQDTVSPLP